MKEIDLLQIGDIHYDNIDTLERQVDNKDKQFPQKFDSFFPRKSYETIIIELMEEIEHSPLAILISGDLSTYGEIQGYKDCLAFLKERIPPNFFRSEPFHKLFIVPGNHDIDRELFSEESFLPKFKPLHDALEEKKFPEIPISKVKIEEINKGNILMISINSCIGCCERRYYPDEIKNALTKLLDEKKEDVELMELCYEKIDTPLISTEDVESVIRKIKSYGDNNKYLPIILTHHNLLPQKRPRIAMYTELINSGYVRERLLMLNRPIIYLHGHIHDDAIEIITSSKYETSKIICISAPLLFPNKIFESMKCGFNKIKIIYGSHETPIGCEITYYRMNAGIMEIDKQRIRFWDPPNTKALIAKDEKTVLISIGEETYLGDLKEEVNRNGNNFSNEEIEKIVDRLSWLGLVEYSQKSNPIPMRITKKVVL